MPSGGRRKKGPHSAAQISKGVCVSLSSGDSPEYVSRQMGHADLKITISTYGRWLPTRSTRAVAPVVTQPAPFHQAVAAEPARPRLVAVGGNSGKIARQVA